MCLKHLVSSTNNIALLYTTALFMYVINNSGPRSTPDSKGIEVGIATVDGYKLSSVGYICMKPWPKLTTDGN